MSELPALVSWRYLDKSEQQVLVCWEDPEGQHFTTLEVDHDVDGASFHYRSGKPIATQDEDFEDLLFQLEGDMAGLQGSEFIPIRAWVLQAGEASVSLATDAFWRVLMNLPREMLRMTYVWRVNRAMRVVENRANPVDKRLAAARRAYRLARHI